MVVNTRTVLAMRCPKCGKLNFHAISLFAFSGHGSARFNCECGAGTVITPTANYKRFSLQSQCGMCEAIHAYYYTCKELFSSQILSLVCPETGMEIGFIGPKEKVKEAVRNQERAFVDLIEDADFADFFDNPDIMYQVLEYLHSLSEKDSLTCQCGNCHIDLDILPDRLELACTDCGNRGIVFAETKEDLLALKQLGKIELTERGFVVKNIDRPKKGKKESKK